MSVSSELITYRHRFAPAPRAKRLDGTRSEARRSQFCPYVQPRVHAHAPLTGLTNRKEKMSGATQPGKSGGFAQAARGCLEGARLLLKHLGTPDTDLELYLQLYSIVKYNLKCKCCCHEFNFYLLCTKYGMNICKLRIFSC